MIPAVPPNSSITTATLVLRFVIRFSSVWRGIVSGTQSTSINTSSIDRGLLNRLFELT